MESFLRVCSSFERERERELILERKRDLEREFVEKESLSREKKNKERKRNRREEEGSIEKINPQQGKQVRFFTSARGTNLQVFLI